MFKKEKLYKIVYKGIYPDTVKTLVVIGRNPVHAMKNFYNIVGTSVRDITEFVEIKYGAEDGVKK